MQPVCPARSELGNEVVLGTFHRRAFHQAWVEVVEPHLHPAAMALAVETPYVRFVPNLTGEYDLLIATDVFEHVPDPIALAVSPARHLRIGGRCLMANCFMPLIACHLPQLFHLSIGWDHAMRAMGLSPQEAVHYVRSYVRTGQLDELGARRTEAQPRPGWFITSPKAALTVRVLCDC